MTIKIFQVDRHKPMAQHRSHQCQRFGDQITKTCSQSGGSSNHTSDDPLWSGISSDRTTNTNRQNDIFYYQTFNTSCGATSLATGCWVQRLWPSNRQHKSLEWSHRPQDRRHQSPKRSHQTLNQWHQSLEQSFQPPDCYKVFNHLTVGTGRQSNVSGHRTGDCVTKWGKRSHFVFLKNVLLNFKGKPFYNIL